MKTKRVVVPSPEEMEKAFSGTNFGDGVDHKVLLKNALLHAATGYYNCHTLDQILLELKLVRITKGKRERKLTLAGRESLHAWFRLPE